MSRKQSHVARSRRTIAVNNETALYHFHLGLALQTQGKLDEAVAEYKQAIVLKPDFAEALTNLGGILRGCGELQEARAHLERALVLRPDFPEALINLGAVLQEQGALEEARARLERALKLKPDLPEALTNLGELLWGQGELEEARLRLERALILKPNNVAALLNLGAVFKAQGKPKNALLLYEQALAFEPRSARAQWNRSLIQLLLGDFAVGWRTYEARYELKQLAPRSFSQPRWHGEPLRGARILLHAEQGLGDTLQFLRYVPMVSAAGGTVLLDVPSSLQRLAEQIPGVAELTVSGEALPPFDWHCPLMTLPLAFRTTLETISSHVPYLSVPAAAQTMADALTWPNEGLRVGLVWSGSPENKNDRRRSMCLSLLEPLFAINGAQFFSLQLGPGAAQLATVRAAITDLSSAIGDMADTAALIAHLDLVITVDTAVAHLAGALAKPTWLLLPFAPDWRWLLDREDSPWYPTMRLYRQPELGGWQSVIARVHADLALLALEHTVSRKPRSLPATDSGLRPDSVANFIRVADPRPVECKICSGPSALFGVVDFHKSCIEAEGRRLPLSGFAVYYRRCHQCGLAFTTAFDTWDTKNFSDLIYNDGYIVVDPGYADSRPSWNANLVASSFSASRDSLRILDFGGGTGQLATRLRAQGFSAATYDPFSRFQQLPTEKFDLITCFEILEHVPFPRDTVTTMVSLLRNPGAILFSTLVQPADFEAVGLHWWYAAPRNGHISLYTTQSLARLFKPHGMRVGSFSPNLHIAYAQIPAFAAHLKLPE